MALLQIDFYSKTLGQNMQMNVILPQRSDADKPLQTLYLLHGMGGDHTDWLRQTAVERYVSERDLAVVMPRTDMFWYTDMAYGLPYFTYLTQELPTVCRGFFRNLSDRREDNFIAGLSMGGYGALKAALSCPTQYAAVAALSSATDALVRSKRKDPAGASNYWKGIFGEPEQVAGGKNDLYALAERCAAGGVLPQIYQWCGTSDFLLTENHCLRDKLQTLGFPLRYEESAGDHLWSCWDEKIQTVLDWLDELR